MKRLVFMFCSMLLCLAQNDAETEATPSDVICTRCVCADNNVDCSNRNIENPFENQVWVDLQNLAPLSIDMSGNPLTLVPRFPLYLPMQTVNLSNCQIDRIADAAFMHLTNLVSLDLSRNKLTTSSVSRRVFVCNILSNITTSDTSYNRVFNFEKMRSINLAYNDLTALPKDLFHFMTGVTFLDLSGNPLGMVDQVTMGTITELEKLEELRLSNCQLENIPDGMFRRLPRLEVLDLSGNRFTTVPTVLAETYSLISLDLSRNPIEIIEGNGATHSMTKLKELRLSELSKLETIGEKSLGGLESLVTLHIRNNPRLTNLDPTFLTWDDNEMTRTPVLTEFYLNDHNLSGIDARFLDRWDQLVRIDFADSSYNCDCRQQWMVDVLVTIINRAGGDAGDMICQTPKDLKGLSFKQLFDSNKKLPCAVPEKMSAVTSGSAVFVGIMIGILGTFPIVLVIVLLWKRGYFAECRRKRQNQYCEDEESDAF